MSSPSGSQPYYPGGFSQPGPHYGQQDAQSAQSAFSQGQPYGASPQAFTQGPPHGSGQNPPAGAAPGTMVGSMPGTVGSFPPAQPSKQDSAFGLREILLASGAFLVFVSVFLPQYRWSDAYYGDGSYGWLWSFNIHGTGVLMLGVLPILAAGLIGVLNKTVRSFPQNIGSFSPDQFVTVLAATGAAVQFVRFIHLFPFANPSWGAFIGLIGAGLAAFAAVFTVIPALGADEFEARESVPAHPKARPVRRAPVQAPAVQPGPVQSAPGHPGMVQSGPAHTGYAQGWPAPGHPGQAGHPSQAGQLGQAGHPSQGGHPGQADEPSQAGQAGQPGQAHSGPMQPGFVEPQPAQPESAQSEPVQPEPNQGGAALGAQWDAGQVGAYSQPSAHGTEAVQENPAPAPSETVASAAEKPTRGIEPNVGSRDSRQEGEFPPAASEESAFEEDATMVSGTSALDHGLEQTQRLEPIQHDQPEQPQPDRPIQSDQPFQPDQPLPERRRLRQAQSEAPQPEQPQPEQRQPKHAHPQREPFWFAVPEPRTAVEASGQPVFQLEPGKWILALADNGDTFTVQSEDGRIGELRNVHGVERG